MVSERSAWWHLSSELDAMTLLRGTPLGSLESYERTRAACEIVRARLSREARQADAVRERLSRLHPGAVALAVWRRRGQEWVATLRLPDGRYADWTEAAPDALDVIAFGRRIGVRSEGADQP